MRCKTGMLAANFANVWDIGTPLLEHEWFLPVGKAPYSDFAFSDDGLKIFILTPDTDEVLEYTLAAAFDISVATYSQAFSVASQEGNPQGIAFKPDGTKMYIVGLGGDDVNEYSLSTPWDVSSATFIQAEPLTDLRPPDSSPRAIAFAPDGEKMFVCEANVGVVGTYTLSTAWDVSTASYVDSVEPTSPDVLPVGIAFAPDGDKMFLHDTGNNVVRQYSLLTPWDISSYSYEKQLSGGFSFSGEGGIAFSSDGSRLFASDGFTAAPSIRQYSLA